MGRTYSRERLSSGVLRACWRSRMARLARCHRRSRQRECDKLPGLHRTSHRDLVLRWPFKPSVLQCFAPDHVTQQIAQRWEPDPRSHLCHCAGGRRQVSDEARKRHS